MAFSSETFCVDVCSAVFCCFTVKQNIAPCAWILTLQFTKVAKMKDWRQRGATSVSATDFSILKSPKPRGEKHFSALSQTLVFNRQAKLFASLFPVTNLTLHCSATFTFSYFTSWEMTRSDIVEICHLWFIREIGLFVLFEKICGCSGR